MKQIKINGGKKLSGTIHISGMKNGAVALIPAAILSDETTTISNVPNISDKEALIDIIKLLNGTVDEKGDILTIDSSNIIPVTIPENLSSKLRASYYFMGALLGKENHVEIYFPGGCNIGNRKINFHLKGFEMLGATITEEGDKYIISAENLKGAPIYLDFASVGATINIMLAAVKAEGTTIINNAAKEPDVANVANFLNNMGAKITGAGTSTIKIEGVNYLGAAKIDVIPDRIEAGTYIIIGSLLGENFTVDNIIREHVDALLSKLTDAGVDMTIKENSVTIHQPKKLQPINIKTLVFPGFVTDLGQPISVLLTQCHGDSVLEETIYENRMGHVPYLNQMGAKITVKNQTAYTKGPTPLHGEIVTASDLRAGAALVIAGLIATGTTTINDAEHILRGYENIDKKLSSVGANIEILDIE